ncbi:sorting nexin-27-like isoform X3 [Hermetia illucens]|uniref:sorting nexin-27-like isoform X3 n=1 Tax=Hermetia illucens TaxID=343691 RepID=UPI0018CC4172|nr:sorting nexin-27-like isoform X3 [Hermetia illucens]
MLCYSYALCFEPKANFQQRLRNRNNVSVEGATHKQVVDLIKSGGDCLTLTVISVTPQEAERLEPQEDPGGYSYIDYSEKRSLPISIPDYNIVTRNGERFIVFNIHMAGRQLCSRRYREFANLHSVLRKEFVGFNFPKLPGKWPFQLSEQQLDARRRGLEQYLEKVCAVRVIAESDAVQDFLTDSEDDLSASPVDIKIMLPDHEVATVSVKKSASAQAVWDLLVQRANFTSYTQQYFYLFEIVEYNFERKLQPHEIPHQLYVQNYSTASSTCLCIRRWLFSVSRELQLPDGEQAAKFIFYQAVDEVNRGNIRADGRLYELKALQDAKRASEYLALARTLPGYGDVVFPHCSCDSRKEGHVVPIVGTKSFRLHACREDGALEAQMVELTWDTITRWESDDEAMAFCFQYTRNEKSPRWVKVYTPYHAYLADCFDRIMEERKWDDSGD